MKKNTLPIVLSSIVALTVGTQKVMAGTAEGSLKAAFGELVLAQRNFYNRLWVETSDKINDAKQGLIDAGQRAGKAIKTGFENATEWVQTEVEKGVDAAQRVAENIRLGIQQTQERVEDMISQGWEQLGDYYVKVSDSVHDGYMYVQAKVQDKVCRFKVNMRATQNMFQQLGEIPADQILRFNQCMEEQNEWAKLVSRHGHVMGQDLKCYGVLAVPNPQKIYETLVTAYNERLKSFNTYCTGNNVVMDVAVSTAAVASTVADDFNQGGLKSNSDAATKVDTDMPVETLAPAVTTETKIGDSSPAVTTGPKIGDSCSVQFSTAAQYINVGGGEIRCAATACQPGSYLVKNEQGVSQGWCKWGTDPLVLAQQRAAKSAEIGEIAKLDTVSAQIVVGNSLATQVSGPVIEQRAVTPVMGPVEMARKKAELAKLELEAAEALQKAEEKQMKLELKAAEKQERQAEREANQLARQAERDARQAEREANQLARQAERDAKAAEKEAAALAKAAEKEAAANAEAAKKAAADAMGMTVHQYDKYQQNMAEQELLKQQLGII